MSIYEKTSKIKFYQNYLINTSKLFLKKPNAKEVVHINFAVTYRCNSRCSTCNIWEIYKKNPKKINDELKLDEICTIFNNSSCLSGIQGINLTGGEPILRKDFVDLCGFFIEKYPNINLGLSTNGLLPHILLRKIEKLVDTYNPMLENVHLSISLDGIKEIHDKMRGISGNYEKILEMIKSVKLNFPQMKQSLSFTITPKNYKEILKVYELSKSMEIGFGIQFAQINDSFYLNSEKSFEWDTAKLNDVENMIYQIISDVRSKQNIAHKLDVSRYFMGNMVKFQRNKWDNLNNCYSGTHSCFLDPYGNVYPCIMLDEKMGNALETNFDNFWLSENASNIRSHIKENKCRCWTPCEAFKSLSRDPKLLFK
ncbi:radical SAM protein [Methanobacterium paludis]|uniref:Radical SAM domain protein n=1 Tax=Methanobacterium paludis (strain DSM 25820 / JCM 18151 / SWAN1) TaxID=868131 RepID=F6D711_METPW|nr:radical SAM protein [Methanobacterium paludis]AEG18378.1 Radical SAM domain protein [Methanobacterium paludis]